MVIVSLCCCLLLLLLLLLRLSLCFLFCVACARPLLGRCARAGAATTATTHHTPTNHSSSHAHTYLGGGRGRMGALRCCCPATMPGRLRQRVRRRELFFLLLSRWRTAGHDAHDVHLRAQHMTPVFGACLLRAQKGGDSGEVGTCRDAARCCVVSRLPAAPACVMAQAGAGRPCATAARAASEAGALPCAQGSAGAVRVRVGVRRRGRV
jgi:hypothetical protein